MLSKRRHVAKSDISPVLFMTVDGEPMSFFLRPSPNKVKLQPLITAGGGLLCNVQRSGAILLIDPEERAEARTYVSTQYIYDCVERGEQLDVEHYRLKPEVVLRHSARLNNSKEGSPGLLGGMIICLVISMYSHSRAAYTPEEDAAILSYVRNHMTQTGGNRLWQEMEKKCVTSHSWQSMKHRYKTQLAKKLSGVEEVKTIKEKTKVIYLEGVASSISAYWIHCDSIMMKTFALYCNIFYLHAFYKYLQNPVETVMIQSTSTEPPVPPSDTPADPSSTQSSPQPRPSLQMNVQDAHKASRAHLFIFDSDSQEDDTQSPGDNTAAPAKPYVNEDAALPLTQVQLEEDRERIIELMDQTKQVSVSEQMYLCACIVTKTSLCFCFSER
uniref:Telomeric repeat-binding factor 2-interacting protein 1 n=1 Tax=Monopterus albus TaxID=43700 RepID=A0A3Q3IZH0_MONAL